MSDEVDTDFVTEELWQRGDTKICKIFGTHPRGISLFKLRHSTKKLRF